MSYASLLKRVRGVMCLGLVAVTSGCALFDRAPAPPPAQLKEDYTYLIGPGDNLTVFVWRNPDLSASAVVRPDGKITIPLVEDLPASGRTSTELARDIEKALGEYVREPLVSVSVGGFIGEYYEQIRVVGQATRPTSLPYRKNMTALDAMVAVGGLTDFAAGNKASIVRVVDGEQQAFRVKLDDLLRDGEIEANVDLQPGDIIIIPEAWF